MDIVIFGATTPGIYLANTLSQEKHSVTLLDPDRLALFEFAQNADIATVCSSGLNITSLKEANANNQAIFIALSDNDGFNLAASALAKALNYQKTIAKITDISLLDSHIVDIQTLFHIDHLLAPEVIIAHDLFKHIINPKIKIIENFAHGKVQMQTHVVPKLWSYSHIPLSQVDFRNDFLIALIKREAKSDKTEEMEIVFPKGDTCLFEGDEVTFIGKTEKMPQLQKIFHLKEKKVHSALICGASALVGCLSKLLKEKGISIKIIESDLSICEQLAKNLPFATILNHSETDKNFLLEENISQTDAFIACSSSTEKNLLVATLAQELGCSDVITLVADETYSHLLNKLDISYALSEKISLANHIFPHIYGEVITSIASLYQNRVKVLEVEITAQSSLAKMKICDISTQLPKKCVLAFILHKDKVTLAKGDETLNPSDVLIVFISPDEIDNFRKLL